MVTIRHRIGTNEGEVIGCTACGEVETLFDGAEHRCNAPSRPMAATIASKRVEAVENSPTLILASPASKPSLKAAMLAAPTHN
jgi:ornithine cyclodeaminase/alanine dehydrogenase-like protein (mu-crystallin family)